MNTTPISFFLFIYFIITVVSGLPSPNSQSSDRDAYEVSIRYVYPRDTRGVDLSSKDNQRPNPFDRPTLSSRLPNVFTDIGVQSNLQFGKFVSKSAAASGTPNEQVTTPLYSFTLDNPSISVLFKDSNTQDFTVKKFVFPCVALEIMRSREGEVVKEQPVDCNLLVVPIYQGGGPSGGGLIGGAAMTFGYPAPTGEEMRAVDEGLRGTEIAGVEAFKGLASFEIFLDPRGGTGTAERTDYLSPVIVVDEILVDVNIQE